MDEEYGVGSDMEDYRGYIEDRSEKYPEIAMQSIHWTNFESAFVELEKISIPRFVEDLERWSTKIHKIVPIDFLRGPAAGQNQDQWNAWSYQHIDFALESIIDYLHSSRNGMHKSMQSGKLHSLRYKEEEEITSYEMGMLPESEQIRYFGYIFKDILLKYCRRDKALTDEERAKRLVLADILYDLDGINGSVERLSLHEHNIHMNSSIVFSALKDLEPNSRLRELSKLKPYSQLAYYASYRALNAGDLLIVANPAERLRELANQIPVHREAAVTSLLSMIAHNLVRVTPAYTDFDTEHAGVASKIFELIYERPDATEKDYVTGTACCEWAGEAVLGVKISEVGLKRYPHNKELINNSISVNNLAGNQEKAEELLKKYEPLSELKDENFVLNKSFNLIKSGKPQEALAILHKYIESGGEKTAKVLVNLFYTYQFCEIPDKEIFNSLVIETKEMIKKDTSYRNRGLLENFLSLISTNKYYVETIELVDFLLKQQVFISPSCWVNYTYAACFLDNGWKGGVIKTMDKLIADKECFFGENPLCFGNLASLHTSFNNVPKAIEYLELCKKYNYPDFEKLRNDDDFKALRNLKQFQDVFKDYKNKPKKEA
jgi:hypothetical protein